MSGMLVFFRLNAYLKMIFPCKCLWICIWGHNDFVDISPSDIMLIGRKERENEMDIKLSYSFQNEEKICATEKEES